MSDDSHVAIMVCIHGLPFPGNPDHALHNHIAVTIYKFLLLGLLF